MNRLLLGLSVLAASAFLVPESADAQRGRGVGIGAGGFGGGGGFRAGGNFRGGGFGGGSRMYIPRGGVGGPRVGMSGGFRGGTIATRPGGPGQVASIVPGSGGFRPPAFNTPGGRFGHRGDWRYGVRPPGSYGSRYPYYRGSYGRYPYYGRSYGRYPYGGWGWGAAGLATGLAIGAATYPYDSYPYPTYETPVTAALGGYCVTPVRTCALIDPAPVGVGCSCRAPGGRARGVVQ
jgi:hypothetical protein